MVEALERFQGKIARKAIKEFAERKEVSFEEFHNFVNLKMGTEFHEEFTEVFYKHFLEVREEKLREENLKENE